MSPSKPAGIRHPLLLVAALALFAGGCGNESHDVENYGPGKVVRLTDAEHQGGFGRNECLVCHNAALNVHRSEGSTIDPEALNEAVKNGGEAKFCLRCHGANGS